MEYKWDKGLFSSSYEIKDQEQNLVGELSNMGLTRDKRGSLHHQKAFFESEGLFKTSTVIRDPDTLQQIGYIDFNTWKTKADIIINGKEYHWSYDDWRKDSWTIDGPDTQLDFDSSWSKGSMLVPDDHYLLALAGMYVHNYYYQSMIVVIVVVMVVIFSGG